MHIYVLCKGDVPQMAFVRENDAEQRRREVDEPDARIVSVPLFGLDQVVSTDVSPRSRERY